MNNSPDGSIYRNPNFLKLWAAQGISQTAQNATFFALLVYVETRFESSAHTSALVISTILPAVLFGVAAGVFVDRWNKRAVLAATNALRVFAVLGYLVVSDSAILFYSLNFAFSTISQFFLPAEAAVIPLLVGKRNLIAANGLFNLTFNMSQVLGFILLGPPLIKAFGAPNLLIGIAVSYVICVILVIGLPNDRGGTKSPVRRDALRSVLKEIADGWRLLSADLPIRLSMIHLTVVATVTLVLGTLAPGFANRVLRLHPEDAVFIFGPAGLGIVLGAAIMPRIAEGRRKLSIVNLGLYLFGIGLALIALLPPAAGFVTGGTAVYGLDGLVGPMGLLMVTTFVVGVAVSMVNVMAQTILQERAPDDMRGRVFAIQIMFGSLASVLPIAFFGQLADLIGVLQVLGVVALVVVLIAYYSVRQTRTIRSSLTIDETRPFEAPAGGHG